MSEVKDCFVASEGFKLAEFDLSQAEARVVAWLSYDEELKAAFLSGQDIHSFNASKIFTNVTYDWIVANKKTDPLAKTYRQTGKVVAHGFNYSMGPGSLQKTLLNADLDYTLKECKEFLVKFASQKPMVAMWHGSIKQKLQKDRTLITPFGMRRYFNGPLHGNNADETYRKAYAFIPQSTVGTLSLKGWLKLYNEMSNELDILAQVHDSLLIQYQPPQTIESELTLLRKIKSKLEIPFKINNETILIPVDCKIGHRWGSLTEVEL